MFVDAFNIDLKSMSKDFYKKVCGADLDIVLDNLRRIYLEGKHLEITNLIINDHNDSIDEITQKLLGNMVSLLKELEEQYPTNIEVK